MQDKKVDFDLSVLSYKELIEVYGQITEFVQFLEDSKIAIEEDKNE